MLKYILLGFSHEINNFTRNILRKLWHNSNIFLNSRLEKQKASGKPEVEAGGVGLSELTKKGQLRHKMTAEMHWTPQYDD